MRWYADLILCAFSTLPTKSATGGDIFLSVVLWGQELVY